MYVGFERIVLDEEFHLWTGTLPKDLLPSPSEFTALWNLHPEDFHTIKVLGKAVKTPRWQQAYNKTYRYTGNCNLARPVPEELRRFWQWSQKAIDCRLNGLLLNWYDGKLGHYMGKHRDTTTDLIVGVPIVTISLGEARIFRLRPWQGKGFQDFLTSPGRVFIVPHATNLAWTHEIPASKKSSGRRISITLRAFK